jgi:DNA-binding SARP family transcriptional activator
LNIALLLAKQVGPGGLLYGLWQVSSSCWWVSVGVGDEVEVTCSLARTGGMASHPSVVNCIEDSYDLERAGDVSAALQRARQALAEAQASGGAADLGAALVCLAYMHHHLGHYRRAQDLAIEALNHADSEMQARADALRILGDCAHETGSLAAAERFYHRAIDIGRQLGYHYILHRCLHSLSACVYIPRGQFELALAADKESLRLAKDLDRVDEVWLPLATMGWVYWITGQRDRALALSEEMGHWLQSGSLAEGYWFCLRADLAQEGKNPEAALPLYSQARSVAEAVGDPGLGAELRVGLSRYYRTTGNAPAAHDWADDALSIATRAGCVDIQGWALIERARAAWELGDLSAAESDLHSAIELLSPMQANFDLARTKFLLAALLHHQHHPDAESCWSNAVSLIASGGYAFLLEQERALAFPLIAQHMNSTDPGVVSQSAALLSHLERVPPPPLHIRTLGQFEVQQGRRSIADRAWRRRRAGELFRLLLISTGRSLSRDQVIEALWPMKSPTSSLTPFHQATSALRQALEPDLPEKFPSRYLEVEGGKVNLHLPPGSWVDFEAFEQYVQSADWKAAVAQYQGELFPGCRYMDWAVIPRERLARLFLQALGELSKTYLDSGQAQEAVDTCHRILSIEPWQESAVLLGMQACMALNDRVGALRLYLDLEQTLQNELGVAPQQALQQIYQSLLRE